MKIEPVDIKKIKERPGNPNRMSDNQMNALKMSIEDYGELQPVIVDANNMLIDGHQRFQAYKELGKLQIPAIRLNLEKESEKKLLSQVLNKVRGKHDSLLDTEEFEAILKDTDMEDLTAKTAISEQEILNLINRKVDVDKVDKLYSQQVTCPACKHIFEKKDSL